MTDAGPNLRERINLRLIEELETKRKALLELRTLIFGEREPDQDSAEWEREAWRIITREVPPCR